MSEIRDTATQIGRGKRSWRQICVQSSDRTGLSWTIQRIRDEENWSFHISEPVVCENAGSLVSSMIWRVHIREEHIIVDQNQADPWGTNNMLSKSIQGTRRLYVCCFFWKQTVGQIRQLKENLLCFLCKHKQSTGKQLQCAWARPHLWHRQRKLVPTCQPFKDIY